MRRLLARAACLVLRNHRWKTVQKMEWFGQDGVKRSRAKLRCERGCGAQLETTDARTVFEDIRRRIASGEGAQP